MKNTTITILGGGIAGLTTAIALKKTGIHATVYEGSYEIKPVGAGLGLGINATMAFDVLGLKEELSQIGKLLPAFTIKDQYGKPLTKTSNVPLDTTDNTHNFTIHRSELHRFLLSKLDSDQVTLGKRLLDFEVLPNTIKLNFDDGTTVLTDYLIAAD